ncbi:MAG: homoserine dehydrogenase [Pirellulaceae bacterium]|nr:homoserine dehydrogenase [Pirellulales bacterium]HCA51152.1 homoserine dehydrogenase [Planctomycetaceae bacterium]|tara:strand:+ start:1968 stop:3266 length:1299 start_codon:yes stop_codon:yes gene_type:complete
MERTKIAIIGMGTVGTGVAKLLLDHGDRTARHAGRIPWLDKVVVRDITKPRDVEIPEGVLTDKLDDVINDSEISVVAQLIGGIEPARSIMLQLLESGKDIITANKALLAVHGPELFDKARQLGRCIAFEASVAGGIPIITNIGQCLTGNQITSLRGILNGTCNFIITQMQETGASYDDILQEAQKRGYAEADPTLDVNGADTTQKLSILSQLAFGVREDWERIPCMGIDTLDIADIHFADRLGYRIKLLAVANLVDGEVEMSVSPTLIKKGNPLAEVQDAFNAVRVRGDAVGPVFFHGQGAGQMPTASAVVADIIDTVVGRSQITFNNLELWSESNRPISMADANHTVDRYYLRMQVIDKPGVMAEITGILGNNGVSIASIIQHKRENGSSSETVPLVIMSHETTHGSIIQSVSEFTQSDNIESQAVVYKVL